MTRLPKRAADRFGGIFGINGITAKSISKQNIILCVTSAPLRLCGKIEFDYVGIIVGKDLQFNADTKKYFTVWDNYKDAKGKQGLLKNPEELNKLVRQIYFVRRSLRLRRSFSVGAQRRSIA